MFILANNNFASASRYILYISLPSLHHYDIHEPALWNRWTQHKNCPFHFVNLENERYGPEENFAKICQIKWNWIRSVKFEMVRIVFHRAFHKHANSEVQKPTDDCVFRCRQSS